MGGHALSPLRIQEAEEEAVRVRIEQRNQRGRRAQLHRPAEVVRDVRDRQTSLTLRIDLLPTEVESSHPALFGVHASACLPTPDTLKGGPQTEG